MQVTNLLDSPEAQTVAQCYRVINTSVLPAITVQVWPVSGKVALIHRVVYVLAYLRNSSVVDEFAQSCTYAGVPAEQFSA